MFVFKLKNDKTLKTLNLKFVLITIKLYTFLYKNKKISIPLIVSISLINFIKFDESEIFIYKFIF